MRGIKVKNLNFSFDNMENATKLEIFKNLNVIFERGKITCVVGHSGCGKTTLLRLLIGLEKNIDGDIFISNDIKLGIVFQEDRLMPWLNLYENIIFGLKKVDEKKVLQLIEFMELNGFEKLYPFELSGGMKQRVALARALIRDSNMILMDEPLSEIDTFTRKKMQNEIVRIKNELNIGIIFVTHSIEEALNIADEIVVIENKMAKSTIEDKKLWQQIKLKISL